MPQISFRQFAAIIGGIALAVGAVAVLLLPVSVDYETETLGWGMSTSCGTTAMPTGVFGEAADDACDEAISTRRAWGWPLTVAGLVVVAAALFVRSPNQVGWMQETGPSELDSEGPVTQ